jgi:hypothetical protein
LKLEIAGERQLSGSPSWLARASERNAKAIWSRSSMKQAPANSEHSHSKKRTEFASFEGSLDRKARQDFAPKYTARLSPRPFEVSRDRLSHFYFFILHNY